MIVGICQSHSDMKLIFEIKRHVRQLAERSFLWIQRGCIRHGAREIVGPEVDFVIFFQYIGHLNCAYLAQQRRSRNLNKVNSRCPGYPQIPHHSLPYTQVSKGYRNGANRKQTELET